jgi:hypothetical protein
MRLFCLVFFRGFFSRFGFFVSGFTLIAAGFGFAVVIAFLGGFFVVFAAVIVFGRGFLVIGFVVVVVFVRFYIALVGLSLVLLQKRMPSYHTCNQDSSLPSYYIDY